MNDLQSKGPLWGILKASTSNWLKQQTMTNTLPTDGINLNEMRIT